MGYKYLKRGIRIGFSFTLGMMLLLSGCSGGMEEMQTSQIPEDMGSATGEEYVNLVELDSSIVELEEGLLAVRYDGDYGFDGFIAQGGASSDGEVIAYLADNLLAGLNLGDLLDGVFGCSTIAVQSPEGDALFGRNFDWNTCEAMVVEAHPDNGYASLSTVNMDFITQNVGGGMVGMALSLDEVRTLAALYAPLDGMNEAGLQALSETYGGDVYLHENSWPGLFGILSAMELLMIFLYVMIVIFVLVATLLTAEKLLRSERRDLTIYRALGFSAGRLRRSFALRFGVIALLGSILGTVFSAFLTDPLVAMLMRMEGISNFSSQPAIWIVLFPGLIVTVLFVLFAWLAARKIKKAPLSGLTAE